MVLVMNLVTVIQNFNNIFLECHVLNIKKQSKLLTVLFNLNSFYRLLNIATTNLILNIQRINQNTRTRTKDYKPNTICRSRLDE